MNIDNLKKYNFALEIILYLATAALLLFSGWWSFVGLGLLAVQVILRRARTGHWFPMTSLDFLIVVFGMTAILGLLVSPSRTLSVNRLWVLVLGIVTFYSVVDFAQTRKRIYLLGVVLLWIGAGIAVASFIVTDWSVGVLGSPNNLAAKLPIFATLSGSGVPNPAEGVHPRLVAGTMILILPLSLSFGLFGRGKYLRIFGIVASIVMIFPLVLSQSPQGYLGLILSIGVMLLIAVPKTLWLQAILALTAVITWWGWRWWLSPTLVARLEFGIQARYAIWEKAFAIILDMPFTGSGLNAFPDVVAHYGPSLPFLVPHAHNTFLQTINDQGVLGFILLAMLLMTIIKMAWHAWQILDDDNTRLIILGCLGSCSAFLGFGMWDSLTLANKPSPLIWVIFAIIISAARFSPGKQNGWLTIKGSRTWTTVLTAIVLFSFPIWGNSLAVNLGRIVLHQNLGIENSQADQNSTLIQDCASWAKRLNPNNPNGFILAGLDHLRIGDHESAISDLKQALELDRRNHDIHYYLANAYEQTGQTPLALIHWEASNAYSVLYMLGSTAYESGDLTSAEQYLLSALQITSDQSKVKLRLAQVYDLRSRESIETGDLLAAQKDAELAIEYDPTNGRYLIWLGNVFRLQGQYEKALAQFDRTMNIASRPVWIWRSYLNRGWVFVSQGDPNQAVIEYAKAVEISEQQGEKPEVIAQNLALLGKVQAIAGRVDEARESLNRALQLDPTNQLALDELAGLGPNP